MTKNGVWPVALLCAASLAAGPMARAQEGVPPAAPPPPKLLTGDWGGLRTELAEKGYTFDISTTGFYQGLAAGTGEKDWNLSGKFDAFLYIDGTKAGWAKGVTIGAHLVDWRFGDAANVGGGMLSPVNTATLVPEASGSSISVSSLYVSAPLRGGGEVIAGRINTLDLAASDTYTGGRGVERFQNISLLAPMVAVRTTPVTTLGAFFVLPRTLGRQPAVYTLAVYDSQESITRSSLSDPFANGVTFFGVVTLPGGAGRKGTHSVDVSYSTLKATSLADIRQLVLPDPVGPIEEKRGAWSLHYSYEQSLAATWGLFLSAGLSDGNPSPVRWEFHGGIGGDGLLPGRPRDRFGLGYYYLGVSDALKDALSPALPLRDEQGGELFYDVVVNDWLSVGANAQVIEPFRSRFGTATVLGLRARVKL